MVNRFGGILSIKEHSMTLLHHGGRLAQSIAQFGIPRAQWLDLSSGVSPWCYPLVDIAPSHWNRLPEDDDGLEQAARDYYGCLSLLPVAGSQAVIQQLPFLYKDQRTQLGTVGLPRVGYKEHQKAWSKAGFEIEHYEFIPSDEQLKCWQALVVINPNNPSGQYISQDELLDFHRKLNGGLLVVDEAFADIDEQHSLCELCPLDNLVVLRSVGKFFGLAGIRVGFVLATPHWLDALAIELGPWAIAGPSRQLCRQALEDKAWQQTQRLRLTAASQRLGYLLEPLAATPADLVGTALFQTLYLEQAEQWHQRLCIQGIYTRLTDERDALRFGLPENEHQWSRLQQGLMLAATSVDKFVNNTSDGLSTAAIVYDSNLGMGK